MQAPIDAKMPSLSPLGSLQKRSPAGSTIVDGAVHIASLKYKLDDHTRQDKREKWGRRVKIHDEGSAEADEEAQRYRKKEEHLQKKKKENADESEQAAAWDRLADSKRGASSSS
jgi:predicted  nucleic acid-binding Zn-ribbon protein